MTNLSTCSGVPEDIKSVCEIHRQETICEILIEIQTIRTELEKRKNIPKSNKIIRNVPVAMKKHLASKQYGNVVIVVNC